MDFHIWFPEHMGRDLHKTRNSGSILEKLCSELKEKMKDSELQRIYKKGLKIPVESIRVDKRMLVKGFEKHLPLAFNALEIYYEEMHSFMLEDGIKSECEIYSGSIIKLKKNGKYHHKDIYDLIQISEKAGMHIEVVIKTIEKLIEAYSVSRMEELASAFYIAAYYNDNCEIPVVNYTMTKIGYALKIKPRFDKYQEYGQMIGLPWCLYREIILERLVQMPLNEKEYMSGEIRERKEGKTGQNQPPPPYQIQYNQPLQMSQNQLLQPYHIQYNQPPQMIKNQAPPPKTQFSHHIQYDQPPQMSRNQPPHPYQTQYGAQFPQQIQYKQEQNWNQKKGRERDS